MKEEEEEQDEEEKEKKTKKTEQENDDVGVGRERKEDGIADSSSGPFRMVFPLANSIVSCFMPIIERNVSL